MSTVSHHDDARAKVGSTAFGVATLRAKETEKGDAALVKDPFAHHFSCVESNTFLNGLTPEKLKEMIDGIAVRTKAIDEEILSGLRETSSSSNEQQLTGQVVVLGAGLDCRAWRLFSKEAGSSVDWYEIDFPEVIDFKWNTLVEQVKATPTVNYKAVRANLGTTDLADALKSTGFDASKKTIWLLEGFTGYLTEDELRKLLDSLKSISATGSRLVATFLGEKYGSATSMHRFHTDQPLRFMSQWGWDGREESVHQIAETKYGRSGSGWEFYYLLSVILN